MATNLLFRLRCFGYDLGLLALTVALLAFTQPAFTQAVSKQSTPTPSTPTQSTPTQSSLKQELRGVLAVSTHRVDLLQAGHYARWAQGFERRYPMVKLQISATSDYKTVFARRLAHNDVADVMTVPPDTPLHVLQRYFVPLKLVNEKELYFAGKWQDLKGHYAYPRGMLVDGLLYNKNLLKKTRYEPPIDAQALYNACIGISQLSADTTGLSLNIGAGWPLQHVDKAMLAASGSGAYLNSLSQQQKPFAREQVAHSVLVLLRRLYDAGCTDGLELTDTWTESLLRFKNGIGFMLTGSWVIPELIKLGSGEDELGFIPPPFYEGKANSVVIEPDWGLAISNTSKQQKLAKAWISYLLSLPDYAATQGLLPSLSSTYVALAPLRELMGLATEVIEFQPVSSKLAELSAIAEIDFMRGDYIRQLLISSDALETMDYFNWRWQQAQNIAVGQR